VLPHHVSRCPQVSPGAALRGSPDRRRQCLAAFRARHLADDAQHYCDYGAVLADRDLRQFRYRADHDRGRPPQHDPRFRHLRLPPRHPQRRPSPRRCGLAVHASNSRHLGHVHPARRAQARERDRMTALVSAQPRLAAGASLTRNRRWALITSYVFLVLFAIFFLTPPYYMIITSLKTDAEVAHLATNPWIIANGPTLEQYRLLFTGTDFLIYFKNTV